MKNIIEPTIVNESKLRIVEATIPAAALSDILVKYDISQKLLLDLLDRYFSSEELKEIEEYIVKQLDLDVLEEAIDTSTDTLINKLPSNELKNMVKSAGVKLTGSESDSELKGMVKVLSKDESLVREGKTDADFIGGYQADVYIKLYKDVDVDELASEIESCLANNSGTEILSQGEIKQVMITTLPKSLFESKRTKLSKFVK